MSKISIKEKVHQLLVSKIFQENLKEEENDKGYVLCLFVVVFYFILFIYFFIFYFFVLNIKCNYFDM